MARTTNAIGIIALPISTSTYRNTDGSGFWPGCESIVSTTAAKTTCPMISANQMIRRAMSEGGGLGDWVIINVSTLLSGQLSAPAFLDRDAARIREIGRA